MSWCFLGNRQELFDEKLRLLNVANKKAMLSYILRTGVGFGLSLASIKKIERYITAIRQLRNIIVNFGLNIHVRDHAEFAYAKNFIESFPEAGYDEQDVRELVCDLDDESRATVDLFMRRVYEIYFNNVFVVRQTPSELDQMAQIFPGDIERKYPGIELGDQLGATAFWTRNGLKFIDSSVILKYSGAAVIDGGAYLGDSAIAFREYYNFGTIYSFEPEQTNFSRLMESIRCYQISNVVPVPMALGAMCGRCKVHSQGGASHVDQQGEQDVERTTIDQFVSTNGIERVGLIKLDVEGSEYDVLHGALGVIRHHKPMLCISIYHNRRDFFEVKKLIRNIVDYNIIIRKIHPDALSAEIMLIGYPSECCEG